MAVLSWGFRPSNAVSWLCGQQPHFSPAAEVSSWVVFETRQLTKGAENKGGPACHSEERRWQSCRQTCGKGAWSLFHSSSCARRVQSPPCLCYYCTQRCFERWWFPVCRASTESWGANRGGLSQDHGSWFLLVVLFFHANLPRRSSGVW